MHPKYLLVLPLWLASATPVEQQGSIAVRGDNNGCPFAHGGCQGVSKTSQLFGLFLNKRLEMH